MRKTDKQLLVPLDGTVESTAILPVARGLAELVGATLDVLHVGDEPVPSSAIADRLKLSPDDVRDAVVHQQAGPVIDTILKEAVEAPAFLIAMCSRMRRTSANAFGSIADGVLRSAPCPVVLVGPHRPREPWALRHLLVPHDGTPTGALAISPAIDLAGRAGADLLVLHVASKSAKRSREPGTFATPQYVDQPHHEWSAWKDEFLARVRGLGDASHRASMRLAFATGDVGPAVVDFARQNDVDLIAIAWHGELDDNRAETMQCIIRHSDLPVVVFRVAA